MSKKFLVLVCILFLASTVLSACASKSIQTAEGEYVITSFHHTLHSGTYYANLGIYGVMVLELKRADGKNFSASELEAIVRSGATIYSEDTSENYGIARHQREAEFVNVNTDSFGLEFSVSSNLGKGSQWTLTWTGNEPIGLKAEY
jgi:hypothetical protein